jgi:DNA-binding MarR family transcriptional regulator
MAPVATHASSAPGVLPLLAQFITDYVREYGHVAERHGLSAAQARALSMVATPMSMRALAERLYCDASNVTGIVARLESRGLVERRTDSADRRVKQVVATSAGSKLHAQVAREFEFARDALERLTEDERALLHELLVRMTAAGDHA